MSDRDDTPPGDNKSARGADVACRHPNCERHGKSPCVGIGCDGTEGPASDACGAELVPEVTCGALQEHFGPHVWVGENAGRTTVVQWYRAGEL